MHQTSTIPISDLASVLYCPVKYYRDLNSAYEAPVTTLISKYIAFGDMDADSEELWEELLFIYPEIDCAQKDQFMEYFASYKRGFQQLWTERDLYVTSKKWDISGIIDKYHAPSKEITLIRGTKAPSTGVYRSDRLRATAYHICMQEMLRIEVSCVIEYVPSGIVRTLDFTSRDRRLFVDTLKLARRIRGGHVPTRPAQAPCGHCQYKEKCTSPSGRRLSDLFRFK